jgi:uroporphyrinogen-III synthase
VSPVASVPPEHDGGVTEPLRRRTIALLETRRCEELAELIRRRGGTPLSAPCLREVSAEDRDLLHATLEQIATRALYIAIFQTGVGALAFLDAAAEAGVAESLRDRLASAVVVARGPKPLAALLKRGLRVDRRTPEPHTTAEVIGLLDADLRGRVVLLVEYGVHNAVLEDALTDRGAEVMLLSAYGWSLPTNVEPMRHLLLELEAGRIHVVTVTSASQIDNLFRLAEAEGLADRLAGWLNAAGVIVAAVGPVSAAAVRQHGVEVQVQPERPKMVPLVDAICAHIDPGWAGLKSTAAAQ